MPHWASTHKVQGKDHIVRFLCRVYTTSVMCLGKTIGHTVWNYIETLRWQEVYLRLARPGTQHLETNVSINWTGVADVHAVCDSIQNFWKGPQPLQDAVEKLLGILHKSKQVECTNTLR